MRSGPPQIPWWAPLLMASSMALVGSYVGLSRLLVAVLPIFLLAWLRFGIAAVAMLPWLRRAPGEAALTPHDRRLLFWESFFGNFLFSIFMLMGVQRTSALTAGIVMAAIPAAVALFSWLGLGERPRPHTWLGIACAISGMALLALARAPAQAHAGQALVAGAAAHPTGSEALGLACLTAAVACEALYVVIGKRLTAQVSPKRISAIVNLWGLALVTPLGLWQARGYDWSALTPAMGSLLVFYALAASMITVWLWMHGLRHVPASTAGVYTVMLPISAAAVGVGLLGESFSALHALALGVGVIGILLAGRGERVGRAA